MHRFFKERNTLKEAIPFISLLSALSIILVIFITYFPISSVVLAFILPLPSIVCVLYTKNRYYLIYVITTLVLSLVSTFSDITYTLFNLVPVLICAFIIGVTIKNKLSIKLVLAITSFIMTFLNIFILFIFNNFFNIDLVEVILNLLNINRSETFNIFIISFVFLFSFVENFIMILVSYDEIKKFEDYKKIYKYNNLIENSFTLFNVLLSFILFFINIEFFYLFLFMSIVYSIIFFDFKEKTLQNSIIFIVFVILSWIIYVIFYTKFLLINSFVIILLLPLLLSLYNIFFFLFKIRKNISII